MRQYILILWYDFVILHKAVVNGTIDDCKSIFTLCSIVQSEVFRIFY